MTKNVTIGELAEMLGEDYAVVAGLIKVMEKVGAAKKVGSRPAKGGRGKPSSIFEIPNEATLVFWDENVVENTVEQVQSQTAEPETVVESQPVVEEKVDNTVTV